MLKDHKALELDKILLQLANETTCPDAAELAQKIEPDTDIRHVERLLQETDDAFVLMAKYGAPSFYGMTNVTNALRRAEAGGVLNLAELLSVAATLRAIRSVSDWRKKSESVKTALDYRFETLQPNKFIEDRISMTVVSEEEVADTASVALAAIRRKIRAASLRVREQLDKMIRSQTNAAAATLCRLRRSSAMKSRASFTIPPAAVPPYLLSRSALWRQTTKSACCARTKRTRSTAS